MIHESPYDCSGKGCDELLSQTATAANLLMEVVGKVLDDMNDRLTIQAETLAQLKTKAEKYLKFRLTKQHKMVEGVFDKLNLTLENRLTEQAVLINTVAPGILDYVEEMGGLGDGTQPTEPGVTKPGITDGQLPVSTVQSGSSVRLDQQSQGISGGSIGVDLSSRTPNEGSAAQNVPAPTGGMQQVVATLPPPTTHLDTGIVSQTYTNGVQVTANVNLIPGELQFIDYSTGQMVVIPIIVPQESMAKLPASGPLAIVMGGNHPQYTVGQQVQSGGYGSGQVTSGTTGGSLGGGSQASQGTLQGGYSIDANSQLPTPGVSGEIQTTDYGTTSNTGGTGGTGSNNGAVWTVGVDGCPTGNSGTSGGIGQPSARQPANAQLTGGQVCVMVQGIPCGQPQQPRSNLQEIAEPLGRRLFEGKVVFDEPDEEWDDFT